MEIYYRNVDNKSGSMSGSNFFFPFPELIFFWIIPKYSYRDLKNKLQKVDSDFRPFRSSEMHEILCLVIIRVRFLKIENKNLVIEVVEEL